MTLARGALPIVDARKRGMKPNELILVSLIGQTGEANHTVFASPDIAYDWRWVVGLQLCLMVNEATRRHATEILRAIGKESPAQLHIWNVDVYKGARVTVQPLADDIDKLRKDWRWAIEFAPWLERDNYVFAKAP